MNLISSMLCAWIYWEDFSAILPKKQNVKIWKIFVYIILFAAPLAISFQKEILRSNMGIVFVLMIKNFPYFVLVYAVIKFFQGAVYTKVGIILIIDALLAFFSMVSALIEKTFNKLLGPWNSGISLLIGMIGIYLLNFLFFRLFFLKKVRPFWMTSINFSIWSVFLFGGYLICSNTVSFMLSYHHIQMNSLAISILVSATSCFFIILYQHLENRRLEQGNYYLNLQKNLMQEHYKALRSQMNHMRKFRHDIAGYLQIIDSYMQGEQYLNEVHTENENIETKYCENLLLNFAIYNKIEECKQKGISVELQIISCDIGRIQEIEILGVLYNLFNNGIEANLFLENSKRFLKVKIQNTDSYLEFIFENPKSSQQYIQKGKKTSKKDGIKHGYGREILRDIAEKYHGDLDIREAKEWYSSTLRVRL